MDNNQLTALPDQLSNLKFLKSLTASGNQLQEFNSVLCEMSKLEFVNVSGNRIKCLPDDMSHFSAVELNLNGNQLPRLPASVAKSERLKVLRVEENVLSLEGVPLELLAKSNVSLLCLDGNVFTNRELSDQPGYEEVSAFTAPCCRTVESLMHADNSAHRSLHSLAVTSSTL